MLGCCFVDGIKIDHTESEVDALFRFIVDKELNGFVELGMHEGGLALCILKEIPKLNYVGVTSFINTVTLETQLQTDKNKRAMILVGDTISSDIVTQITTWMVDHWPILFYCDGEHKISQLMMYRNLIRFGDFLGVHDYWNKSRILPELPKYPYDDLPKPEVHDEDLRFLRKDFQSVRFESLIHTRIAIYNRRTK
jgi:cephalosporin hydroxylase